MIQGVVRSFVVAVAVVVAVAAGAPTARADDREDARREFTAGQAADRAKNYPLAIEHYLRANDLAPHPFTAFNIASDYEQLGQLREAATWYQRYLDIAPADAADRPKVKRLLAELLVRPARLGVRSVPDGARVTIDGKPAGVTPYVGAAKGGTHRIAVELDGVRDERVVDLVYGEPADVAFTLAASGMLVVAGTPVGALVMIDGAAVGTVPATVSVAAGPHTVQVTSYGYAPYEVKSVVRPGGTERVDVGLTRALGTFGVGPQLNVGYLIGGAAGGDLRGSGALVLGTFGARISQFDLVARVGKASDLLEVDLLFRWAWLKSRVSPFVAGGYSFLGGSGGFGYQANLGLRWDVARGDGLGLSLLADVGARYASITGPMVSGQTASSGFALPIELAVEIVLGSAAIKRSPP